MYTLKVTDGDLDFSNRHGVVLTGKEKLTQQLGNWIAETIGVDRFHSEYGSNLQNLVGSNMQVSLLHDVEKEVRRVVTNYMNQQAEDFDKNYQNYSKEEVIVQILLINAYAKSQSVYCDIYIKTLANTTDALTYEVLS